MSSRRPQPRPKSKTVTTPGTTDWLARAMARAGVLPLEEAEKAIAAGRVTISGRVVHQAMALLRAGDTVRLDGTRLDLTPVTRVLAFNKPAGIVTAARDKEKVGTVFERLAQVLPLSLSQFTWHAVGRLDRDTTGLLLFTNDERLVAHVTSPASNISKRYRAQVHGELTSVKLGPLRRGMELDDGPTLPAEARIVGPDEVELVLTEGRNHQAKRMLGAVGLPVKALRRVAIGTLALDVEEGQVRELTAQEVADHLGFERNARAGTKPRSPAVPASED